MTLLWLSLWCCTANCMTGPNPNTPGFPNHCVNSDADHDLDVDLRDVAIYLNSLVDIDDAAYTAIGARP